jgi:peroxiredoxin
MADVGSKAPEFTLKAHDGNTVSSGQYGGKWVVVSAYPLAFTGG